MHLSQSPVNEGRTIATQTEREPAGWLIKNYSGTRKIIPFDALRRAVFFNF
jgi:hypothetical protein